LNHSDTLQHYNSPGWVGAVSWTGLVAESLGLGSIQATLSNLLTDCVVRPTQPPTLSGMRNE